MAMEKVRPLDKLPLKTKLAYCKILSLMLKEDSEPDQLKLAALYRLMAHIKITTAKRQEVLQYLNSSHRDLMALYRLLNEGLNLQEKNIVRFSLYKDLIIIMRANYVESPEEALLLSEAEEILDITEEHKAFIEEELQRDKSFYDEDVEIDCLKEAADEAVAVAAGIGIPLAALYYSSYTGSLGFIGIVTGLHAMGRRLSKRHSLVFGIGISIGMALLSYRGTKWLLNYSKKGSNHLKELMAERLLEIHQLAICYLEKDIVYLQDRAIESKSKDDSTASPKKLLLKLRKTKALLEGTEPMCL